MTSIAKLRILKNLQGRYTLKDVDRPRKNLHFFRYNFGSANATSSDRLAMGNHFITICVFSMAHGCKNRKQFKTQNDMGQILVWQVESKTY
jgi:hypothetical protein